MTVKYKVSDFAKDLNVSAKKVLDELNAMGSTGKKNSSNSGGERAELPAGEVQQGQQRQGPGRVPEQRQGPQGGAQACREEGGEEEAEGRKEARGSQGRQKAPAARRKGRGKARSASTTATRRTSSTRSARKRPFPCSELARETGAKGYHCSRTGRFCPPRGQSGHRGYPHCGYERGPLRSPVTTIWPPPRTPRTAASPPRRATSRSSPSAASASASSSRRASARPSSSVCSASSWKRPATPS